MMIGIALAVGLVVGFTVGHQRGKLAQSRQHRMYLEALHREVMK